MTTQVKIKSYRAVAVWTWALVNNKKVMENRTSQSKEKILETTEECGICHAEPEFPCPRCIRAGEQCPPTRGTCGHLFHMHCIEDWLSSQADASEQEKTCPMCRAVFEFQPDLDTL
jgi:anaphase-promoting complex subunit 11